jgi:peptidyl-Lys metalloendopeptidase
LKVLITLTNDGDQTLKLLNDPRGSLNSFPANSFFVTHSTGASPAFVGAKVKYLPSVNATSFTVLTPGQSVDVSHDLSAAYNLTSTGEGVYTIEPSNLFTYIDNSDNLVKIYAKNDASEVSVSGSLSVSRIKRRATFATFNNCTSSEQTQVNTAATNGNTYAANAYTYVSGISSGTTRYTTWFGAYTSSRYSTVVSHYQAISSHSFSDYSYDCTCAGHDSSTFAYVYPDTFGAVNLCPAFWNAPATGTDSQGGTLVHESSHFTVNGGTQDSVYGQADAQSLAISNPDQAIMNADNHEYFAENNPAQS